MSTTEVAALAVIAIIIICIVVKVLDIWASGCYYAKEEEPIYVINDPVLRGNLRTIREQKDEIEELRMLLGALETSTIERMKKAKEREDTLKGELLHTRQDFSDLQDLAIWMTGCGYDFTQHPYYMTNKYLFIDFTVPAKTYTQEEAKKELLREVPCPVCESLTIVGMHKIDGSKGSSWEIVEGRYCPVCSWKAIPIEESDIEEQDPCLLHKFTGADMREYHEEHYPAIEEKVAGLTVKVDPMRGELSEALAISIDKAAVEGSGSVVPRGLLKSYGGLLC
jgi:hypothetical protein